MNYHFCIDDKFIDDFIKDAESVSSNNTYVFLFDPPANFVKSKKGINAVFNSKKLDDVVNKINEKDKVFFHPYIGLASNEIVRKLPKEVKVYAMFWGFEFLQLGINCGLPKEFTDFLYEPLTLDYVKTKVPPKEKNLIKHGLKLSTKEKSIQPLLKYIQINFDHLGVSKRKTLAERKFFLKRVEAICHWNRLDIDILEKMYKLPIAHKMFSYSVGLSTEDEIKEKKTHKGLNIFLGNSDTETNNHLDAFELLKGLKSLDIKIYCPLNYHRAEYAEMISKKGKEIFGEKFIPMLTFLARDEYYKLLDSIDICFMNHIRTQAGGNIWAFINKGAKIFLNEKSTIYKLYKKLGLEIYRTSEINKISLEELNKQQERSFSILNKKIIENYFLQNRKSELKEILK